MFYFTDFGTTMLTYFVGVDGTKGVFVANTFWKKSETEVYWPPQTCKNADALLTTGEKPTKDWDVYTCKWTSFESSNFSCVLN